ncbi:hypothetical protein ACTFIR_009721 [Dictyostelium discoideum]
MEFEQIIKLKFKNTIFKTNSLFTLKNEFEKANEKFLIYDCRERENDDSIENFNLCLSNLNICNNNNHFLVLLFPDYLTEIIFNHVIKVTKQKSLCVFLISNNNLIFTNSKIINITSEENIIEPNYYISEEFVFSEQMVKILMTCYICSLKIEKEINKQIKTNKIISFSIDSLKNLYKIYFNEEIGLLFLNSFNTLIENNFIIKKNEKKYWCSNKVSKEYIVKLATNNKINSKHIKFLKFMK